MKTITKFISLMVISAITILIPTTSFAQNYKESLKYKHNETPSDTYVPMLPKDTKTSPAYHYRSSNFYTTQVNINQLGNNILGDAANEPSIAIDPTNPDNIVIGWRQFDNVISNFRQAGNSYSTDGGQTWTSPDPIEQGIFRSDPVLDTDAEGNFYYNSLTKDAMSNYWCDVFKSEDGGVTWDNGTYAYGGDKQWMVIDKTEGIGNGNIYEFWNSSYSSCYPGSYTRSTNGGDDYDDCDGVPGDPIWGTLAVGPDGELYTVGAYNNNGLTVTKSENANDPSQQTVWENSIFVNMLGGLSGWKPINPSGLLGQAYIDVDKSDGASRGNVYVLAAVLRTNGDPGDVMFSRSTDGGQTWNNPIRINDDPTEDICQWLGTMSVAPNGRIDAVWLDTRNAPSNNIYMSELYYSFSVDQGLTWSINEKLSAAFDPHVGWPNQEKMGDYFHMISDDDGAHLAWANTLNNEQDVYYGYITPWFVGVSENSSENLVFINYPNPISTKTTLSYKVSKTNNVKITIFNTQGNIVDELIEEQQNPGNYNFDYNASKLANGIYFCRLTVGTNSETIKLTKIN